LKKTDLGNEVYDYYQEKYQISPEEFILRILEMSLMNSKENINHEFFYIVKPGSSSLIEKLSIHYPNKETEKLISLRKSPFIKLDENKYILSDISFLYNKPFSQFINDFWFEGASKIKDENGNNKYKINNYRSIIGLFFEDYITQLLGRCFQNYKYCKLLMFDDLKMKVGKNQIELADIYLRWNKKILIGQVKSGSIYDKEKFGRTVEDLYKNDRANFFKNFGITQIVDSIANIYHNIDKLDIAFRKNKSHTIYPCIICNDVAFQTPLMAHIFNEEFQKLMRGVSFPKIRVKPLSLIHINDIERLEMLLRNTPKIIWDTLDRNNIKVNGLIQPFSKSVQSTNIDIPPETMAFFEYAINTFNPNADE
jgi:hypothetical protein